MATKYILVGTLTPEQMLAEFAMFDQQDLIELTNEGPLDESTGVNWTVLLNYCVAAEKEFDFYAGQIYTLPITLPVGADFLRDIMRRRTVMWKRIQRGRLTEDERAQYDRDQKVYQQIASGTLRITAESTETVADDGLPILTSSQERFFTHYNEDGESELDQM